MLYRIVGIDGSRVVIQFRKNREEITFRRYDSAREYLQVIKSEKVIPDKYHLEIV